MRKIISLAIISLMIGIQTIYAQTPSSQSPERGDFPEWSSDSQMFVYENIDKRPPHTTPTINEIFKPYPAWEAFNPNTGTWYESNVWPLYPNLSAAESSLFQTQGFIRTSPDGEILIYPSLSGKLTLANRTTQQVFETDINYEAPNVLPVWWSEDGQGIAIHGAGISPYVFQPIVYYVRLIDRLDLTQTRIYFVRFSQPMIVGNRIFTPIETERILDVQQHQVLTTMSDLTNFGKAELATNDAQSYLVIWNPDNPQASVIIDAFDGGSLRGAAFVPNDPQHLLLVLGNENAGVEQHSTVQQGLYVYNIQTKDLQFLATFDGYYINRPFFSPNGNWLALSAKTGNYYAFFRTSDLLALPPLAFPTAFPTLTPPPTYTMTPYETPTPTHTPTRQG